MKTVYINLTNTYSFTEFNFTSSTYSLTLINMTLIVIIEFEDSYDLSINYDGLYNYMNIRKYIYTIASISILIIRNQSPINHSHNFFQFINSRIN